jgi:nicotinate-nucleotide pyrophosphorylase (carboxylating)
MHTDELNRFISMALAEDVGDGDHTSLACIPADKRDRARLLVKESGIIAGVQFAQYVFNHIDPSARVEIIIADGEHVVPGDVAFEVECTSQALLKVERLVLNVMQRMSAIATLSRRASSLRPAKRSSIANLPSICKRPAISSGRLIFLK